MLIDTENATLETVLTNTSTNHDNLNYYNSEVETLRQIEYSRLKSGIYLDNAASPLYAESLVEVINQHLKTSLLANPHTTSSLGFNTKSKVDKVRLKILKLFEAEQDYSLIFTSNATQAIKILVNSLNLDHEKSTCVVTDFTHNSLINVRNFIPRYLPYKLNTELVDPIQDLFTNVDKLNLDVNCVNLIAYTAQCNFSGTKFEYRQQNKGNDAFANLVANEKLLTLCDIASCASTSKINLRANNTDYLPDFLCLSFYKIFGLPTGLGALLVKKTKRHMLIPKSFGGGTISASTLFTKFQEPKSDFVERFEEGTINFIDICNLDAIFDRFFVLFKDMSHIQLHCNSLTGWLYSKLNCLKHGNDQPLVKIYSRNPLLERTHGPIIAFNLLRDDKTYYSPNLVAEILDANEIYVRSGTFCNPSTRHSLGIDDTKVIESPTTFACDGSGAGDLDLDGYPTGAIRISLAAFTTLNDLRRLLDVLVVKFIQQKVNVESTDSCASRLDLKLDSIYVYPIKSCGGFKVLDIWPVTSKGLKYDRNFAIATNFEDSTEQTVKILNIKNNLNLANITTAINLNAKNLTLSYKDTSSIILDLDTELENDMPFLAKFDRKLVQVVAVSNKEVDNWLTLHLGQPCKLVKVYQNDNSKEDTTITCYSNLQTGSTPSITTRLANEAPFLLTSQLSLQRLDPSLNFNFRTNLHVTPTTELVNKFEATDLGFEEENVKTVQIGYTKFQNLGKCQRCSTINLDLSSKKFVKDNYLDLSKLRNSKGRVYFGILMGIINEKVEMDNPTNFIRVGDKVTFEYQ